MAPSGSSKTGHIFGQRNIYACALGNPHRFHFGHAIGMANLANRATRKSSNPLKVVGTVQRCQAVGLQIAQRCWSFDSTQLEMNVSQSYREGVLLRRQFWQRLVCHRHIGLLAGTRNLGSPQSGPGLIVNQILPQRLQANRALMAPLHTCLGA